MEKDICISKCWNLGVYGDKSQQILKTTVSRLRRVNGSTGRFFSYIYVGRSFDNELRLEARYNVSSYSNFVPLDLRSSSMFLLSNAGMRKKIAAYVKKFVKESCGEWDRDKRMPYDSTNSSVHEAYALYDCLLDRRRQTGKFGEELAESIIGHAFDPLRTETEMMRQEEIARLKEKRRADISEAKDRINLLKQNLYEQIEKLSQELSERKHAIDLEYEKAVNKLNEEIEAAMSLPARDVA